MVLGLVLFYTPVRNQYQANLTHSTETAASVAGEKISVGEVVRQKENYNRFMRGQTTPTKTVLDGLIGGRITRIEAERLGLTDHGVFLGWIGDDALHSLYRIADLTVVPSLYEPFGLVALEAMASGCPCIVADTGGLREVVPAGERVGLRFNGGDPEHLGVMIERLLVDEELRDRLVTEASEHVLSFDWSDVAQRTTGVYRDLASGRAQQRA